MKEINLVDDVWLKEVGGCGFHVVQRRTSKVLPKGIDPPSDPAELAETLELLGEDRVVDKHLAYASDLGYAVRTAAKYAILKSAASSVSELVDLIRQFYAACERLDAARKGGSDVS